MARLCIYLYGRSKRHFFHEKSTYYFLLRFRSVKQVLQQEFEDKTNFIANNPFFQTWAPKYKKQLAMALEKDVFPYDGVMTKQGEPVSAIYFILK